MLEAAIEAQIQELTDVYGAPLRWDMQFEDDEVFDPLGKSDRYGEVCMVIRRPNGKLITAVKTYYPAGAFRLLTGGVQHGESALHALLRETAEETGLQVAVRSFLAVVSYRLRTAPPDQPPLFITFALLLDEIGGVLHCDDPSERVAAFGEVAVDELPELAAHLRAVPDTWSEEINGSWRAWGRFRAIIHDAVFQALSAKD